VKQVSGKEFVRIRHHHGWWLKRVNGSHPIVTKEGHRERVVIPVHGNQPLKPGLL
jgi:predicted RNA binding protein YcfA (HicA-like mRNA interferase family)